MIKCFQCAVTVELNHEKNLKYLNGINPFYNKYNWKGKKISDKAK